MILLSAPAIALYAHAEIYMSDSAAAALIFPGRTFTAETIELSSEQVKKIEAATDQTVRSNKIKVFKSAEKDFVFIDQVLGKHEFITYAVGVSKNGKVAGIEILEYRESYGQQVRGKEWRDQFIGKDSSSKLKAGNSASDDIKVISGATLSSNHIAAGVKRILKTFEIADHQL
jgi:uncharacterized protein with FMN-binding domain